LSEFYWVATRKLGMDPAGAAGAVEALALHRVAPVSASLVQAAIQLSQTQQLAYWDALVIAAAAETGCPLVLTEDLADGSVIAGVEIRNPFAD
ncbi:MAG: PIN domain-containing protein, partial [Bifidobacteriaceae bacterium]|nr:PIN domain-containing protein [Bifidobacteriaceae bacterium]